MPTADLSGLVRRFGHDAPDDRAAADGDLLARFVAARVAGGGSPDGETAFAELVRRHGPMVLAVCRRVTGSHHLAEDAFQATFVVLATKAASVRPAAALPGWLHTVARRTALRARTMTDRRRRREAAVGRLPDAAGAPPAPPDDLAAVLDEEIARLPDALRAAVVMCELEGVPRKAAAERLGVPEGTVSSRLAAARKALAARLRRRGVALPAVGLAAALGPEASATVPADLAARAVGAATAPGSTPAAVAALSQGVLRVMFAQKLKAVVVLAALAVGVIACAACAAGLPDPPPAKPPAAVPAFAPPPPVPEPARARAEPKPLPKGPNRLLFAHGGNLTLIDPDGKNEKQVSTERGKMRPGDSRLSPDGKTVATLIQTTEPREVGWDPRRKLYVRGLDEKEPGTDMGIDCQMFFWSPDGTRIVCSDFVDGPDKKLVSTHHVLDVKTKEKTALKLPDNHAVTDWSPDGKFFLTTSVTPGAAPEQLPEMKLHLMNRDGTEHTALTDGKTLASFGRLAPDGKRVLFLLMEVKKKEEPPTRTLAVLDVATGKAAPVEDVPLNAEVQGYCWSPDGKRIAYSWRQVHEGRREDLISKETESFLVVCDPDGKNARTIASEKDKGQWIVTIGHIDWR